MRKGIWILTIISILLCGCGQSANYHAENLSASYRPQTVEHADPGSQGPVITDFGLRLLQESWNGEENILISPLSVITALSMTANGADSQTLTQMETVLGANMESMNPYLYNYAAELDDAVHCANSIWFRESDTLTIEDSFLQTNTDYYGAGIFRAVFDDTTLKEINCWVSDNTAQRIPEILDIIPEDAMLYLVNALAFDGEWTQEYKDHQVRSGEFTAMSGTARQVEMMHSTESFFLETQDAMGFLKSYKGSRYAFAALIPKDGISLETFVNGLSGEILDSALRYPQEITVYAALPEFQTEYSAELSQTLIQMGMPDAFDWTVADFSRMGSVADERNLCIGRVLHKTFLHVGPLGTEAGAATVVEMLAEGCAMEPEDSRHITLDRPFLYMIVDCSLYQPLFLGVVTDIQ